MTWVALGVAVVGFIASMCASRMLMNTVAGRYEEAMTGLGHSLEVEVAERLHTCEVSRHALILALAKLTDYRDTDTGRHLERICAYSVALAEGLAGELPEIDRAFVDHLRVAASLHDIGKVGIPDSILLKESGLTEEERRVMQRHTIIGADTLRAVCDMLGDDPVVTMAIEIAQGHHEWWDGTGYPRGISSESIPLSARIVALADVYDALTSRRCYKSAMAHGEACALIKAGRGTQFDPAVVDAFESIADTFDRIRMELAPPRDELDRLRRRIAA